MKKIALISTLYLVMPMMAMAQPQNQTDIDFSNIKMVRGNNLDIQGIVGVLKNVINWIFTLLLIFAVIMVLVAAYNYLFSRGDDEKISKANKMLLYAAVAVAVGLLAQAVVFIVNNLVSRAVQ
ncbi:MAG: hypothetical protein COU09_00885 [Candidatus Harrisonbacteria bacterium CG10_big_fil_rev_8_21_14_0_10_44_23]|uniref:DUF4134 domain-containing protein n=1 Tax=Candidatus Harrisonbacteria bacterium CG10_big_fil_rev_8_21_14_0_10_44_23 TaxID=1974585 RepID=A0A2H0UQL2_9BACT|nr:MAG: hypothetical protein COU09_00885 [Candidatus Harrisonbacteria bacterium CG10_big_fil_rev_8_21_14_0_10_44_23]